MILLVSGATRNVATADPTRVGFLLTPRDRCRGFVDRPHAIDNGAFRGFDELAFVRLLERVRGRPGCLFVAAPDVVGDHAATVAQFPFWRFAIKAQGFPVAFVVQNGCTVDDVPWELVDAVFIGGDTAFKLSADVDAVLDRAAQLHKWRHVGRVNTRRRIRHFRGRADSIDGSGFSQWPRRIDRALHWIADLEQQPRLSRLDHEATG